MPIPLTRMSDLAPKAEAVPEFYVDLDGTLKTDHKANQGDLVVRAAARTYRFDPRPGFREFLSALSRMGPVTLATAGGREYASKVLRKMGAEDLFSRRVDAMSWRNGLPFRQGAVFVDDDLEMARMKVRCMRWPGTPSDEEADRRIVLVPTYRGGPDSALMDVLPEIRKRVASLGG